MTLPLMRLTSAGKAAMVNVKNTGTAAIQIVQIGVTAQSFVAAADLSALPGEIKRLVTFAGDAVADDTIHVTLRDDSTDQYTLRGFGLYSDAGVLIATYCGADPIMEKSAQAMLLLAVDGRIEDGLATSLTFGDTSWMNPPATTTVQGVVELADDAESIAGTDNARAVPPTGLKAALDARLGAGAPSAFVKGLLTKATAALLRVSLEIKSAALKDEGAGKGLDADLLDGQHGAYYLQWDNLAGVPGVFTPAIHRQDWQSLDGVPATASRWPRFSEVTDRPPAYPPEQHVHAAAAINSGVLDVARVPNLDMAKINGLDVALNAKAARFNPQFTGTGIKVGAENAGESNIAFGVDDTYLYSNVEAVGFYSTSKGQILRIQKSNKYAEYHGQIGAPSIVALDYGANGGYLQVGNDVQFLDVGMANSCAVTGVQNPNVGYLSFGNSRINFGWDGGNLVYNGGRVWHAGNFNPDAKANNNANVTFADIFASRGNDTGVLFFGNGNHYLYWDGSRYYMPNGQLVVDGGFQKGSSRGLKDIDGPLPYGLAELMRIETAIGSYKQDYYDDGGRKRLFVIAEQLAEIVPEPVFVGAVDYGEHRFAAVEDGQLVPLLIKAVQELAQRVFVLERGA